MELLQRTEDRGYPTDYLLSRIRSRKIGYRDAIAGESPEGSWKRLLTEYKWVYLQMNNRLRDTFNPFFLYHELGTLVFSLRFKHSGEKDKTEEVLRFSLLSKGLKGSIKGDSGIISAIEDIERVFLPLSQGFSGISETYIKDGFRGVEQRLTDVYLGYVINTWLHPIVRSFFVHLIDIRNIISLYKRLRWGLWDYPPFIQGGRINEQRLSRIFKEQNASGLASLVGSLTGTRIEKLTASNIENSLLKWVTVLLERSGRDPLSAGVIMSYLWRCYIETMNRSIILYGRGINSDAVEAELVR